MYIHILYKKGNIYAYIKIIHMFNIYYTIRNKYSRTRNKLLNSEPRNFCCILRMYIYMYICVYVCVCICVYIYIIFYIHVSICKTYVYV